MAKVELGLATLTSLGLATSAVQPPSSSGGPPVGRPQISGACVQPSSINQGKFGCFYDAQVELADTSGELFYHIDEFASRREADAAKPNQAAVVEAYGRWFVETVNSEADWRPRGGKRLATIGPMPRPPGARVTARFMQAMTKPGATTQPHSHDGPEAFHVLTGAICMESPMGIARTEAGKDYWIGGGHPMQLSSIGTEVRRSLFVVIHPSDRPWMNVGIAWKPTGACSPGN